MSRANYGFVKTALPAPAPYDENFIGPGYHSPDRVTVVTSSFAGFGACPVTEW